MACFEGDRFKKMDISKINLKRTLVARIGVSFVFLVFGVWEIIQPGYWTGFVPRFLESLDLFLLVRFHGIILLIIGTGILSGFYIKKFAIAASLILLSIIFSLLVNFGFNDIVVRDIVILLFVSTLLFED